MQWGVNSLQFLFFYSDSEKYSQYSLLDTVGNLQQVEFTGSPAACRRQGFAVLMVTVNVVLNWKATMVGFCRHLKSPLSFHWITSLPVHNLSLYLSFISSSCEAIIIQPLTKVTIFDFIFCKGNYVSRINNPAKFGWYRIIGDASTWWLNIRARRIQPKCVNQFPCTISQKMRFDVRRWINSWHKSTLTTMSRQLGL